MNPEEKTKKMQQIIARAVDDAAFKQRLMADPAAVLNEEGLEVPAGLEVRVVENSQGELQVVLPAPLDSGDLSEKLLDSVAAGWGEGDYRKI